MQLSDQTGSCSIVCTMREVPEIAAAFVAHHLSLDVDEIFVFLDSPDPVVEALLAGLPRCRVTVCDNAYWQASTSGERPESLVPRQMANAEQARKWTGSDWLIHIDADEFLFQTEGLRQSLAAVPANTDILRVRNRERFLPKGLAPTHIFEGNFRAPFTDELEMDRIYGPLAGFLNWGVAGYKRGKTVTRVSSAVPMMLHPVEGLKKRAGIEIGEASVGLLHFDGFTALHWTSKLLGRLARGQLGGSKPRKEQMGFLSNAATRQERLSLFDTLLVLDAKTEASLAANGLLTDCQFDPAPAMATVFPGHTFDLSPQAFDKHLVAARPDWFRDLDLA